MHTPTSVIHHLTQLLMPHYHDSQRAQKIAWMLVEHVTTITPLRLITHKEACFISPQNYEKLLIIVEKHLIETFPLQYIFESVPFGPLEILVKPPVLIPRPETEEWCAQLVATLTRFKEEKLTILDMCTGSGCIGLWLAHALPNSTVYAVDIADHALALAQENAAHNNIKNIHFLRSNLFDIFSPDQKFDLIVANPPYIDPRVWHDLSPSVRNWEDRGALVAQQEGLEILMHIIHQSPSYLSSKNPLTQEGIASLVLEIGYDQGRAVMQLCKDRGFSKIQLLQDTANCDRVVCCWK